MGDGSPSKNGKLREPSSSEEARAESKIIEAKEIYIWALKGKKKAWGTEYISTLDTINVTGPATINRSHTFQIR